MGSGALYRQEQKETLGPLRIHTRDLIAKVILRLAYSGVTDRTVGKRVFFFISLSFSLHFFGQFPYCYVPSRSCISICICVMLWSFQF